MLSKGFLVSTEAYENRLSVAGTKHKGVLFGGGSLLADNLLLLSKVEHGRFFQIGMDQPTEAA